MEYLLEACVIFPLPLLLIAWSGRNRKPIEYSILTLSAVLLLAAAFRSMKFTFLGKDFNSHPYTTISVNLMGAVILGVHLGMKRRWIAAGAAVIIALGWVLVGATNSVI